MFQIGNVTKRALTILILALVTRGQAGQLLVETWDSKQIDSTIWNVVEGPHGKIEFDDLGGGDYALALSRGDKPPDWEVSVLSWLGFRRGENLRVTFKVWGNKDRESAGHVYPNATTLTGPWHDSFFDQASPITIEAGIWLFWPDFSFDENHAYAARALPDAEVFSVAWAKALSKESALQIRVTLGDETGAMFEWFDGMGWHTSIDTRGQSITEGLYTANNSNLDNEFGNARAAGINIGYNKIAKVGFAPYVGWITIDDIVVENDSATKDAIVPLHNQAAEADKRRKATRTPVPWTHQNFKNDPNEFQFAIIGDLTGGLRREAFLDAVRKLNLMVPEFVMSIGDLIEGMTWSRSFTHRQLDEFDEMIKDLEMPFYYVPGNHDLGNMMENEVWKERYGRDYYHFVYKDVLFLCLNSNDPYVSARFSREQIDWVEGVLEENKDVRWTLVFMHDPMWVYDWRTGWEEIEAMLQERKYTVYAGHFHHYIKFDRLGTQYYVLASTGSSSTLAGVEVDGNFDHLVWITMTDDGPIMVNYELKGIYDDNPFNEKDAKEILESKRASKQRGGEYYGTYPAPGLDKEDK